MTVPPWVLLLLLIALAFALLYQLVTKRYGWRIIGYWVVIFAAAMGFEALAESLSWNYLRIGDLRLLPDMVGCALALAALWFLGV